MEDATGSLIDAPALPGLGVRPDACLVAEPTDLALSRSHRGFAVVRVTIAGRAAHSSQAELGVNAVTALMTAADRQEQRTGRPSRLASTFWSAIGQ